MNQISRRKFFFFGLAAGIGLMLPDNKIISYEESREEVIARMKKLVDETMNEYRRQIDAHLYGIPYHENNASIGTWLGISRS